MSAPRRAASPWRPAWLIVLLLGVPLVGLLIALAVWFIPRQEPRQVSNDPDERPSKKDEHPRPIDSDDGKIAAAWVIGLESPYYAITDDAGRYRLDELAPGSYEITFWQPPVASLAPDGTWTYGSPVVVRRTVRVERKPVPLSITLPAR